MADEYHVSPHVHWCSTEDGTVMLDAKRGKYFAMDAPCRAAISRFLPELNTNGSANDQHNSPDVDTEAVLAKLLRDGTITRLPNTQRRLVLDVVPPEHSVLYSEAASLSAPRMSEVALIAKCYLLSSLKLRTRTLNEIASEYMNKRDAYRQSGASESEEERVRRIAMLFIQARAFVFSSKDRCLLDSLTMLEFFRCKGLCPFLIFGVATKPFSAHCWIQYGRLVLNDSLGRARRHNRIFAI